MNFFSCVTFMLKSQKVPGFIFFEIILGCMNSQFIDNKETTSPVITADKHVTSKWPVCTGL
jgi:hypothetical protein